jgi:serine phosphatase RsbU (regulator of sigma subunit)
LAILPEEKRIYTAFPDSFIYYRPKDIVSGDFYWYTQLGDSHYLAVADCTGHGVPGAFMSMLGTTLLKEITQALQITSPDKILERLHDEVIDALVKETAATRDGMDIALVRYTPATRTLDYAGAFREMLYYTHQADGTYTRTEYKADRQPIGGTAKGVKRNFELTTLQTQPGDMLYLFTDGYPDQFGGDEGRKYMAGRFKRFLDDLPGLPAALQSNRLDQEIDQWRGGRYEQVDDILVAGLRF